MLTFELLREHAVLALTPSGPLRREDFEQVARAVDPWIEQHGALAGLLISAEAFPGWHDFGALVAHLRFVREHHRAIAKVAVVSDDRALSWLPGLVRHFVAAQVRSFPSAERDKALAWLAAPGD